MKCTLLVAECREELERMKASKRKKWSPELFNRHEKPPADGCGGEDNVSFRSVLGLFSSD